ncbi:hypothetical protein ACFYO6_21610 [Streptomyces anthocyanicus]|uniref:Uncharacterized protein n=1 Tax=Streptomyces violaceoruber TaxID=1935 RepID=A0ACD4WR73_STRVN|nr:hypothetical protein [Streptomyces sp. RK76]MBQ0954249.1 hypothetical protein [Streptomyces sp. RK76]WOY99926.1 hypothetical protein R2E43_21720 [Streptomyces violaceoruber]BDD72849.1 hypothetical protein JCM4020_34690 [Streptomyces coelicolor]
MTALAVTGHMDLTEESVPAVRAALDGLLARYRDSGPGKTLVGISCIARGADSLFAEAVLAVGGRLVVVVPSRDYRRSTVEPDDAPLFDRLAAAADEVVVLPRERADRQAYEAANALLLERADRLVAVWNGEPPSGRGGGTADLVLAARAAGIPVDVVWPAGAARRADSR